MREYICGSLELAVLRRSDKGGNVLCSIIFAGGAAVFRHVFGSSMRIGSVCVGEYCRGFFQY